MTRRTDKPSAIEGGIVSSVEFRGTTYHVQTQCSRRDAPVIESLVFQGGQTLVRFTSSYDDVARRLGFSGDDGRHLIEHQHANLIQKIRHGLLRHNAALDAPEPPQLEDETVRRFDAEGVAFDPSRIEDAAVGELLQELSVAVDNVLPQGTDLPRGPVRTDPSYAPRSVRAAASFPTRPRPATVRPWWRRFAVTIRLRSR